MKNVIPALLFIGLLVLLYTLYTSDSRLKKADKEVYNIQKKIDSVYASQEFIMSRMYLIEQSQVSLSIKIDENTHQIEKNNKELLNIKKAYNEKIRNIDNYSYNQLDSFFANRYPGYKKY